MNSYGFFAGLFAKLFARHAKGFDAKEAEPFRDASELCAEGVNAPEHIDKHSKTEPDED